jgi:hypothetical protein
VSIRGDKEAVSKYLWDDGSTIYVRDVDTGEVVASVDDAKQPTLHSAICELMDEAFSETDSDDPILVEVQLLKNRLGLVLWDYLQSEGLSYEEVGAIVGCRVPALKMCLRGDASIRNILSVYAALGVRPKIELEGTE